MLNLTQDHMDRYDSMVEYATAKRGSSATRPSAS
jgi:UDP-N-acetylmuramoylalanine-D-glutamate ligase